MVRAGKPLITTLLLCVAGLSHALVGDWKSYTHLDQVQVMTAYGGQIYVGTTGGIRQLDPLTRRETVHNNPADGILDVHVIGFAITGEDRLYAVSRKGFLYLQEPGGGWETIDRGFDNFNWKINPRAVLAFGSYVLLGNNKGLSFFSTKDKRLAFSLTQFGPEKDLGVTALLMRDSVLYIGTAAGSFRANLYWPDLENPPSGYGNVFNPQIWEPVGTRDAAFMTQGVLVEEGDSVRAYPMGSYAASPEARAVPGLPLVLGGQSFDDITQVHAAAVGEDRLFAGDSAGLYEVRSGRLQAIRNPAGLPNLRIANIRLKGNTQYLWTLNPGISESYVHKLTGNTVEQLPNFILPQVIAPISRNVRGLNVVGEDEFYLGNWGQGVMHYNRGQVRQFFSGNTCLEGTPNSPIFTVVRASIPFKDDEGLFLSTYHVEGRYKLSYLDYASQSITCYDISGLTNSSQIKDPITLENFENGNAMFPLELRVLGDTLLLVGHNKGVDLYHIRDVFNTRGLVPFKSFSPEETLDPDAQALLVDGHGRLWVSTRKGVYYQDNFLDVPVGSDTLLLLRSMAETNCEHIQEDGRGTLWLGCSDGLIRVNPTPQQAAPEVTRLGIRDGLLDPEVVDLQIDRSTGHLWIVSEKGIARYESPGRTPPANIKSADVYPNPFKPQHPFVVFDNLTENSEVMLLNRAGNIVYHAQARDIDGSQWQWKGTNESGRSVSSGIYYYLIRDGSEVRKGKLIVAR